MFSDDLKSLSSLPTLILSETYGQDWRPAAFGRIGEVERSGAIVRFRFESLYNDFSSEEIFMSRHLNFSIYRGRAVESSRTHWAVKRGNLTEAIFRHITDRSAAETPKIFNVERWPLPNLGHVAVMMPFSSEFDRVYVRA